MTPVEALDRLEAGGLTVGAQWSAVHDICQAHEGEQAWDLIHALVHRIEGDEWNAGYWYRRAGQNPFSGDLREEWRHLRDEMTARSALGK